MDSFKPPTPVVVAVQTSRAAPVKVTLGVQLTAVLELAFVIANVADPVEFSSYPSLLLVTTTARITLTVSTTRAILLHGDAGEVVRVGGVTTSVVVQAERATEAAPTADAPRNARRFRRSKKSGLSDMIPPVAAPRGDDPYPIPDALRT